MKYNKRDRHCSKFLSSFFSPTHQVQCCSVVVLPSPDLPDVGIQHVWVISGDKGRSQVAVTSLTAASLATTGSSSSSSSVQQARVIEAFKACDELVMCAETVPAAAAATTAVSLHGAQAEGAEKKKYVFPANTVWMGTDEHK